MEPRTNSLRFRFCHCRYEIVDFVLYLQYKEKFNAFKFVSERLRAVVIGIRVGYAFAPLGASCL